MYPRTTLIFLIAVLAQAMCQTRVGDSCVENYTKTYGKCAPAESCTTARNDYQQNGIRPTFCTYSAFGTTLVCCRDGSSILNSAGPNTVPPVWSSQSKVSVANRLSDTRRVSERSDEEYTRYPADEDIYEDDRDHIKRTLTFTETASYDSANEEELLTKLWAIKLKKLSNEQRRYAEKIINDILFEADTGSLTEKHLKLFTSSCCEKKEPTENLMASPFRGVRGVKINTPLIKLQLSVNNPAFQPVNFKPL